MHSKPVVIVNRLGLHARAADRLVRLTQRFASRVKIHHGDHSADCKNIMDILMMGAGQGTTLNLSADGEDEKAALEAIDALFSEGFGEQDAPVEERGED